MNIIGVDFSISKPAAVVFENNNYHFYIWPKDLAEKDIDIYKSCNVNIVKRENIEIVDKVRYDITNANILSDLIIASLKPFINQDTKIAFEGTSFGSRGNVTISIVSWRYILICKLIQILPLENIFTYSPMTIKSIAGCSKKVDKGKNSMIEAFKRENINHPFCQTLRDSPEKLKKKTNYISGIDDLCDAFWTLKTLQIKENL